jgi:hypothetical protein
MGETREDLGTMADPGELAAALTVIGLLQRGLTDAEQARETERAGGVELHRLEMAHALAGAAEMQVLMAAGAAADAGADPAKITRASNMAYQGANCDDDETTVVLLASQLMVMVADSHAGRAEVPLVIYPGMLVAAGLEKLLEAATSPGQRTALLREAAAALRGGADLVGELAGKAGAFEARHGK